MAVHLVAPTVGWSGIAAALELAAPGDEVQLQPGTYRGTETLRLSTGVTLLGLEGALLAFEGEEVAVLIADSDGARLIGLTIEGYRGLEDFLPGTPEPEDLWQNAIVLAQDSHRVEIRNCNVTGLAKRRGAIALRRCRDVYVIQNRCCGARRGIELRSSHGELERNECFDLAFSGILLGIDEIMPESGSISTIRFNKFYENGQAGIALSSSTSPGIEDNVCWGNGSSGIQLQHDPNFLGTPSNAPVRANQCHDNGASGITINGSTSPGIEDNVCWGNGLSGIQLQHDCNFPGIPSNAPIRANQCHGNGESGITIHGSTSSGIEDNVCWGNGWSGIQLQHDRNFPGIPSNAPIGANKCHDNGECGITIHGSTSPGIEDNACWGNGRSGIQLQHDLDSPGTPSNAPIHANQCHDNGESGITIHGSTSPGIDDNACWGNGGSGIQLQHDPQYRGTPSNAPIGNNRCHENGSAGIALLSSISPAIEGNACWKNRHQAFF